MRCRIIFIIIMIKTSCHKPWSPVSSAPLSRCRHAFSRFITDYQPRCGSSADYHTPFDFISRRPARAVFPFSFIRMRRCLRLPSAGDAFRFSFSVFFSSPRHRRHRRLHPAAFHHTPRHRRRLPPPSSKPGCQNKQGGQDKGACHYSFCHAATVIGLNNHIYLLVSSLTFHRLDGGCPPFDFREKGFLPLFSGTNYFPSTTTTTLPSGDWDYWRD